MPISWTLKNIFVMLVGLGLLGWGAWMGLAAYTRLFGIGLGLVGLATMALGMTVECRPLNFGPFSNPLM